MIAGLAIAAALAASTPATNVHADKLFRDALVIADRSWQDAGLHPPLPRELRIYYEPAESNSVARAGEGNVVYLGRAWRDGVWAFVNDAGISRGDRRAQLVQACAVMMHERGHNMGFAHTPRGVMADPVRVRPLRCRMWAARWISDRKAR